MMEIVHVELIEAPTDKDWMEVKRRALVTGWLKPVNQPTSQWKRAVLKARHSPIRRLVYSFYIEGIPYCNSVHLCRHVHLQPFVASQRNDRQKMYDRNSAPQNAPVNMIVDVNAEMLMVLANKRLCHQADEETRYIVQLMCTLAEKHTPELKGLLVPMCFANYGHCNELKPCGKYLEYVEEEL